MTTTTTTTTEVGRGAWRKSGGATPFYELTVAPPQVGEAWWRHINRGDALPDPMTPTAFRAVNAGVRAIQGLLNDQLGLSLTTDGWLGRGTADGIRAYQTKHGLTVDGQLGPKTAQRLCRPLVEEHAARVNFPFQVLNGLLNWESAYDFGAMGHNNYDTGIAQINLDPKVHGAVTGFDDAMNPTYAIRWAADGLLAARKRWEPNCVKSGANPVYASIANHNSPLLARRYSETNQWPYVEGRAFQIETYVMRVLASG